MKKSQVLILLPILILIIFMLTTQLPTGNTFGDYILIYDLEKSKIFKYYRMWKVYNNSTEINSLCNGELECNISKGFYVSGRYITINIYG